SRLHALAFQTKIAIGLDCAALPHFKIQNPKSAMFYPPRPFTLSFELFPPKTPAAEEALWENLGHLMAFKPDVVTCTYGAGGSTRNKTPDIVDQVRRRYGVRVASHLTCVGSTVERLCAYLC